MAANLRTLPNVRKAPRQQRSSVTVEAICEATLQVLLSEGEARLTTTRIARRAGVSVGTLYQYFPHKGALLNALLRRHLEVVVEAVEAAAARLRGARLATIAEGLVAAYLDAKLRNLSTARALYAVAAEPGGDEVVDRASERVRAAIDPLLASACDATFADLATVSMMLRATLAGAVRPLIERGASPAALATLRSELPILCRAYLEAAARVSGT